MPPCAMRRTMRKRETSVWPGASGLSLGVGPAIVVHIVLGIVARRYTGGGRNASGSVDHRDGGYDARPRRGAAVRERRMVRVARCSDPRHASARVLSRHG